MQHNAADTLLPLHPQPSEGVFTAQCAGWLALGVTTNLEQQHNFPLLVEEDLIAGVCSRTPGIFILPFTLFLRISVCGISSGSAIPVTETQLSQSFRPVSLKLDDDFVVSAEFLARRELSSAAIAVSCLAAIRKTKAARCLPFVWFVPCLWDMDSVSSSGRGGDRPCFVIRGIEGAALASCSKKGLAGTWVLLWQGLIGAVYSHGETSLLAMVESHILR